jgi:uncharacterized protein DUF4169
MGDVVNLKRKRKQKARVSKATKATENAAKHGRSRSQVVAETNTLSKAASHLDNHRIEKDE